MDPMSGLRLGSVPYLNAAPLVHGLQARPAVPSLLASWLDAGTCELAAALSKAAEKEFKPDHLPFTTIEFSDDGKAVTFSDADKTWRCDLDSSAQNASRSSRVSGQGRLTALSPTRRSRGDMAISEWTERLYSSSAHA